MRRLTTVWQLLDRVGELEKELKGLCLPALPPASGRQSGLEAAGASPMNSADCSLEVDAQPVDPLRVSDWSDEERATRF
jgi:hypothetical protein